jgi:hypothetical protein
MLILFVFVSRDIPISSARSLIPPISISLAFFANASTDKYRKILIVEGPSKYGKADLLLAIANNLSEPFHSPNSINMVVVVAAFYQTDRSIECPFWKNLFCEFLDVSAETLCMEPNALFQSILKQLDDLILLEVNCISDYLPSNYLLDPGLSVCRGQCRHDDQQIEIIFLAIVEAYFERLRDVDVCFFM